MRILILGPSGQIGYELAKQAVNLAEVTTAGRSNADVTLDPLDRSALGKLFNQVKPDIVINAIAYTAVDQAEVEQELSFALNSDLPSALADYCAMNDALLIHYSTDFVFDGTQVRPWRELDTTNPLSVYGKSKLAGEKAIKLSSCTSLILRTSWVYGERGNNFMLTMLQLARERETLAVVNDQFGSPSYSVDIATATLKICELVQTEPDFVKAHQGLYHLSAGGDTSWYGFAKLIFKIAAKYDSFKLEKLLPISSEEYPTKAIRPANSVLECGRILETFAIGMPHWQDSLKQCLQRYYR